MSGKNESWPNLGGFIYFNPLGEISSLDFMSRAVDMDDARKRAHSNFSQIFMATCLFALFIRNTRCSIELLYKNSKSIPSWCCFFQAFMGTIFGMSTVFASLSSLVSCREVIWIVYFGLTVSSICVTVCLLMKAYAVQMHDRRLLWIGGFFILPQFSGLGGHIFVQYCQSSILPTVYRRQIRYPMRTDMQNIRLGQSCLQTSQSNRNKG